MPPLITGFSGLTRFLSQESTKRIPTMGQLYSLKRAGTSQPDSCSSVGLKGRVNVFQPPRIRQLADLPPSSPWPCGSERDRLDDRRRSILPAASGRVCDKRQASAPLLPCHPARAKC